VYSVEEISNCQAEAPFPFLSSYEFRYRNPHKQLTDVVAFVVIVLTVVADFVIVSWPVPVQDLFS